MDVVLLVIGIGIVGFGLVVAATPQPFNALFEKTVEMRRRLYDPDWDPHIGPTALRPMFAAAAVLIGVVFCLDAFLPIARENGQWK